MGQKGKIKGLRELGAGSPAGTEPKVKVGLVKGTMVKQGMEVEGMGRRNGLLS